ncbi:MAG: hypothetical protein WC795_01955 [Candidatus Paceibacterota bacterium]|jgi:hypothetical protein
MSLIDDLENVTVRYIYCEACRRFEPHQIAFKKHIYLPERDAHALGEHGYRGTGQYVEFTVFCYKCYQKYLGYLKEERRIVHINDYNALILVKDNFGIKRDELLSGNI